MSASVADNDILALPSVARCPERDHPFLLHFSLPSCSTSHLLFLQMQRKKESGVGGEQIDHTWRRSFWYTSGVRLVTCYSSGVACASIEGAKLRNFPSPMTLAANLRVVGQRLRSSCRRPACEADGCVRMRQW